MTDDVAKLVTTRPEAEIAADLKRRIEEAFVPVCAIFDEALAHGLITQWDQIGPKPPFMRCGVTGLRLVKFY